MVGYELWIRGKIAIQLYRKKWGNRIALVGLPFFSYYNICVVKIGIGHPLRCIGIWVFLRTMEKLIEFIRKIVLKQLFDTIGIGDEQNGGLVRQIPFGR